MESYTSHSGDIPHLLCEARSLYQTNTANIPEQIRHEISRLRKIEGLLEKQYAFNLRDCDILDIGTGQYLLQMHYFGRNNRVDGIDLNVIAQGINPLQYVRMLRLNGAQRVAKTIVRKLLG